MRIWKRSMLIIGIYILLFSTMNAIAEEDPTGDIYHQTATETGLTWDLYSGEKQHIDITDISYSISGSQATLTMTLADDILSSAFVSYYMHLRTDEAPFYTAVYSDGYASLIGPGGASIIDNPISGKIFTTTFDITDPNLEYTAWGWAGEFTDEANQQTEGWLDYAPGTYAPWYTADPGGDDDDTGDDEPEEDDEDDDNTNGGTTPAPQTPGFEIILLLTAAIFVVLLFKRKK